VDPHNRESINPYFKQATGLKKKPTLKPGLNQGRPRLSASPSRELQSNKKRRGKAARRNEKYDDSFTEDDDLAE